MGRISSITAARREKARRFLNGRARSASIELVRTVICLSDSEDEIEEVIHVPDEDLWQDELEEEDHLQDPWAELEREDLIDISDDEDEPELVIDLTESPLGGAFKKLTLAEWRKAESKHGRAVKTGGSKRTQERWDHNDRKRAE